MENFLPDLSDYYFLSDVSEYNKVMELADFLYTISVMNLSNTNINGTFSNIYNACNTLQSLNSVYFSEAQVVNYSSTTTPLITCMKNRRPVYCRGEYTKNNEQFGHAWVVDGYSKREREVTIITKTGYMDPEVRVRPQSAYFFHINWGYCGLYDGYYYTGVFDMAARQGYNMIIDTNLNINNGTVAYSQNIRYISY